MNEYLYICICFVCFFQLKISTSARIRNWLLNALKMPSAATCRPTTPANVNPVSRAMERSNVWVRADDDISIFILYILRMSFDFLQPTTMMM